MATKKKATKKQKIEATKSDILGFRGGMDVNLSRIMSGGGTLRDVLSQHLKETLLVERDNDTKLRADIVKWKKQYKGIKPPKSFPWPDCFSRDTEVLTADGWKGVSDIDVGMMLFSMNPETGEAGYQTVTSLIKKYEKSLLHIRSKSIDLLITPNHNMAVWSEGMTEKFKFVKAKNLNTGHKIPLTSTWNAKSKDELFGLNSIDLMEFVGWYISEGWTFKHGTIGISQSLKNAGKRARIRDVLDRLKFKYSENKNAFLVSAKSVPLPVRKILKSLGKSWEKFIPRMFIDLSEKNLLALLGALINGDGNIRFRLNRNHPAVSYYTTSMRLADDVQEIVQKIGLRARITETNNIGKIIETKNFRKGTIRHKLYVVSILFKDKAKVGSTVIEEEDYEDNVYCFTVPPYNSVYVRRNGIATWCGQCANVSVPVSRSRTDIAHVRLIESIFGRKKIVVVKAMKKEFIGIDRKIEDAFNHFLKYTIKLKENLNSPLLQCTKIGTGVVKLDHIEKKRTVYRYATEAEVADPKIHKYNLEGTKNKAVKYIETSYVGPTVYSIDRSDFKISSDATSIEDAYLVGFDFKLRKPQIELKVRQGLYYREEADFMTHPSGPSEAEKTTAELQGKELKKTEYEKPYKLCELWFDYDVDEDGEEDSIVVTFHEETGAILRAIYNPIFKQFKPFQDFVFYPTEGAFDGEGICEILENLQVQVDTIVNQRLDRGTAINCPWYLVDEDSELAKRVGNRIKPGEIVRESGNLDKVLREIRFSDVPPSAFQEEAGTVRYMDQAVGVTADVMGISTTDRPVFRETMAHLGEAYKKFNYGAENVRRKIVELIYKLFEMFTQYQPSYTYNTREGGVLEEKTVDFPVGAIRDGFNIELYASSDEINQDARREKNMTVYQILKDYMTGIVGMGQFITNQMVPSDFKKLLIKANEVSAKMLTRVFDDFDVRDAEDLVLDISEIIDIQKAVKQSIDMIPPEQKAKMMAAQQQQQTQGQGTKPTGGAGG